MARMLRNDPRFNNHKRASNLRRRDWQRQAEAGKAASNSVVAGGAVATDGEASSEEGGEAEGAGAASARRGRRLLDQVLLDCCSAERDAPMVGSTVLPSRGGGGVGVTREPVQDIQAVFSRLATVLQS